jgi:hypothetical protein
MITVLTCSLVAIAVAATGAGANAWVRRRRQRDLERTCHRMRCHALDVAGDTERLVDFVRTHDRDASESPHWRTIRTRRAAVVNATRELRDQDVHLGLRRATLDLCSALAALDLELHRRRALSIAPDGGAARDDRPNEPLMKRLGEVEIAARFMSIVARVDECRAPKQCSCASTA